MDKHHVNKDCITTIWIGNLVSVDKIYFLNRLKAKNIDFELDDDSNELVIDKRFRLNKLNKLLGSDFLLRSILGTDRIRSDKDEGLKYNKKGN